MQLTQRTSDRRILFFDNIRYLLVLLVIVMHAACAYSYHMMHRWAVNDINSLFFDLLLLNLDVFLMPGLFFIAGYFALPSLITKDTWSFVKNKLKRLGIPWLIGVLLMGPLYACIYYESRNQNFWTLWTIFITKTKSAISLNTGFITTIFEFNQLHFWFISLLFLFFILFAMIYKTKSLFYKDQIRPIQSTVTSKKSIVFVLLLASIVITALTLIMHKVVSQGTGREPWLMIGSILQFQPTRLFLYVFCFGLGSYAYHKKWFKDRNLPGNYIMWMIVSIILCACFNMLAFILPHQRSPITIISFILLRTLLFFSILLTLVSFGQKHWDNSTKINRLLAKNSYSIYIIHMIFVYVTQWLLLSGAEISIYFKFIITSASAILLSLLFSHFVIKRSPVFAATSVIGFFGILLLSIK